MGLGGGWGGVCCYLAARLTLTLRVQPARPPWSRPPWGTQLRGGEDGTQGRRRGAVTSSSPLALGGRPATDAGKLITSKEAPSEPRASTCSPLSQESGWAEVYHSLLERRRNQGDRSPQAERKREETGSQPAAAHESAKTAAGARAPDPNLRHNS